MKYKRPQSSRQQLLAMVQKLFQENLHLKAELSAWHRLCDAIAGRVARPELVGKKKKYSV